MVKKLDNKKVEKLLLKKVFTRTVAYTTPKLPEVGTVYPNDYMEAEPSMVRKQKITQDKFLAELDPRSHDINNKAIYPDKLIKSPVTLADGSVVEQTTITEIARVSVALQKMIATKQCVHLFAKTPKFTARKGSDSNKFSRFKEYWSERNAQAALYLMAKSALTTGDGAVCFFLNNGILAYKVWSYKDGDVLIPTYKKNGIDLDKFVRRYSSIPDGEEQAVDTLDIYSQKTYTRLYKRGNDYEVAIPETTHGFPFIPIAYHREPDVAWGEGQDLIDKIERLLSDIRESNAYFAFGIMFLSGDDVTVMPPKTSQGKLITSQDATANAKLLDQPNMSESLKFEFNTYIKELFRITGTVSIDPEILKGGDQSGAYIKNLYNDAIQYAMDAKPRWQPVLEQIVAIVKEALSLEERDISYRQLYVISEPDIYVPMNIQEEVTLLNLSKQAGVISQETASQSNFFASPDEYSRLQKEEELKQENEIKNQ